MILRFFGSTATKKAETFFGSTAAKKAESLIVPAGQILFSTAASTYYNYKNLKESTKNLNESSKITEPNKSPTNSKCPTIPSRLPGRRC